MLEIEKPRIQCDEVDEKQQYARFTMEPLERGLRDYARANSLRRILLYCLPGAAVTKVKFDGVLHEFGTIEGVYEDITNIILNLKQLSIRMYTDEPKKLTLDISGAKDVTAADIVTDSEVEIVNPDLHIATVNSSGSLYAEITVEKGRGYVLADKNKTPDMPIGIIPTDSMFTPHAQSELHGGQHPCGDRLPTLIS